MKENDIVSQHAEAARQGFATLQRITSFCCCGCGLCVSICPEGAILFDEVSKRPVLAGTCCRCGFCYLACPRSFLPLTRIRAAYYGNGDGEERRRLGNYVDCFAARSLTAEIYLPGTPGGTTTALVHYLMQKGEVTAALLTRGKHRDMEFCMHPEPYIATSPAEVLQSAHSKFEITPVLSRLRELANNKACLVVGTPCHIMAIRKLQVLCSDAGHTGIRAELAEAARPLVERIKYCVSINCFLNHTSMDEVYAWLGIEEGQIKKFNENASKQLYDGAVRAGKGRRWLYSNNYVTADGREIDYDVYELGRRVLASGCLVCESQMVSREADASIGMFGADGQDGDFGWNSVVVMDPALHKIFARMAADGMIEQRPLMQGCGRTVRTAAEWLLNRFWPGRDVWGVGQYLATGQWQYPSGLRKLKGTRRPLIRGLELVYLAQTIRKKIFYEPTIRALTRLSAYQPTIY